MITSYGIILHVRMGTEKYFLIANRGCSYEYVDMFNQRCPIEKVYDYVRMCTQAERQRLTRYIDDFDTLYYDSLGTFRQYHVVKDRFDKIKPIIKDALQDTPLASDRSLYGFPKGRKKTGESGVEAALREFEEEVKISRDMVKVSGLPPLEEKYIGSDGKKYKNVYYRCSTTHMIIPRKVRTRSRIQGRQYMVSKEILDVKWMKKEEALEFLDDSTYELL